MLRLRALIWIQSVLGLALVLGILAAASTQKTERVAIGLMGIGVLWLLAFAPLRLRAARLPVEESEVEWTLPWLPKALGIGQFVTPISWLFGPWASLILVADAFLFGTIVLYVLFCTVLNLQVSRVYWGKIVAILAFGVAGNVAAVAGLYPLFLSF